MPDAQLPPSGLSLRAFVRVDAQGAALDVATQAPADAPLAFQKVITNVLQQAAYRPGDSPMRAYCLLVRFDPEADGARLAWLPGVANDARRCLYGRQPAARDLEPRQP